MSDVCERCECYCDNGDGCYCEGRISCPGCDAFICDGEVE